MLSKSKSQYSLIRDVAKMSEFSRENFYKFVWKEISIKKNRLML